MPTSRSLSARVTTSPLGVLAVTVRSEAQVFAVTSVNVRVSPAADMVPEQSAEATSAVFVTVQASVSVTVSSRSSSGIPSPSVSVSPAALIGNASTSSFVPSLSSSSSQRSPSVSPSLLSWLAFTVVRQLSSCAPVES